MKIQRKHIFKTGIVAVLALSLLAQLIVPLSNHVKKTAFTKWLTHNVISSGSESEVKLINSIRELPEQSPDFWMLVQQASELVAANKDDFKIRLSMLPGSYSVTSYLIGQWSIYQSHSTAQNAVIPEIIQSINKWLQSNSYQSAGFNTSRAEISVLSGKSFSYVSRSFTATVTIVLFGSISINAP